MARYRKGRYSKSYSRRSGGYSRASKRKSTRRAVRKRSSSSQTVRIVIEQGQPNPVGRPDLGLKTYTPRKRRF